jgi:hypothetical protein
VTRATKTAPSEAPLHPTPLLVTGARKKSNHQNPSETIAKRRLVFLARLTGHVGHSSFVTAKTKKEITEIRKKTFCFREKKQNEKPPLTSEIVDGS